MNTKNFIFLNVPAALQREESPPSGHSRRLGLAYTTTIVSFLMDTGLLLPAEAASAAPIEVVKIRLHDLTPEGQDFIMTGATDSWLGACDRRSNKIRAAGASEEEGLSVYRDSGGLYRRLEKFRKERASKAS